MAAHTSIGSDTAFPGRVIGRLLINNSTLDSTTAQLSASCKPHSVTLQARPEYHHHTFAEPARIERAGRRAPTLVVRIRRQTPEGIFERRKM